MMINNFVFFLLLVIACDVGLTIKASQQRLEDSLEHVAIITLAVGPRAKSFAETLIQSYENNADTDCPLFLVTEDIAYFDKILSSVNQHTKDRVHFVLVGQDPAAPLVESDNPEERQKQKLARAVERAKNNGTEPVLANNIHMRVKLLKTKLLKLVPSQYEYVLYVDSDMVFGKPLKSFLYHAIQKYLEPKNPIRPKSYAYSPNKNTVLALFPDIGLSTAPYHTGVMLLSRSKSRHLLSRWASDISTGKFRRDQRALVHTVRALHARQRVALFSTSAEDRFFTFVNGTVFESLKPFTFVHATMYRLTQPERFGFTHEQARRYYNEVLHAPYLYDFLSDEAKVFLEGKV